MNIEKGNFGFDAEFIDGSRGRLLVVRHTPPRGMTARGSILCVSPFAEELNRSRHMLAHQARAFARLGYEVLLPDLTGCGDSEGDFEEATWTHWLNDLLRSWQWLAKQHCGRVSLWGLRAGALLVADLVRRDELQPAHVLLWQPTARGETVLNEFLRVALTAQMLGSRAEKTTLQEMRERLTQGETLDIAGYRLNPEMAAALVDANLTSPLRLGCHVGWLEVSSVPDRGLRAASLTVVESWRNAGIVVDTDIVVGPRFWSTAEIAECPAIVEATCRWLGVRTS